jgi:hypothetical protein
MISIKNDTKTSDQKKVNFIWGITKPAKVKPPKVKPETLNSEIMMETIKRTITLITHLKAPRVIKFMGVSRRLRTGLTIMFSKVKLRAVQKRTTKLSEYETPRVTLETKKIETKLMEMFLKSDLIYFDFLIKQYHSLPSYCNLAFF